MALDELTRRQLRERRDMEIVHALLSNAALVVVVVLVELVVSLLVHPVPPALSVTGAVIFWSMVGFAVIRLVATLTRVGKG